MAQRPGGGGGSFPRYSGTFSGGYQMQNLLSVAEFLVSNGYSRTAAAGITGAIAGESSGDPEAVGSGGAGLIGWTPPSKAAPIYPIVTGSPQADFNAQLTDLLHYNNTSGPTQKLKRLSGDPVAASDFYSQNFERPAVTDSDVRANVAQSIYSQLGGYKPDAGFTQYSGDAGSSGGSGSSTSGSGGGLGGWVSSVWTGLKLGFDTSAGEAGSPAGGISAAVTAASDPAQAIVGLTAPFVKIADAVDWFMQPSHWARIFCGIGGSILLGVGLWNISHVGGQASSVTVAGTSVPTSAGGTLALPLGILEVGLGGALLFVAFHNLPSTVKTLPDFLSYLQEEISKPHDKAPAPEPVS